MQRIVIRAWPSFKLLEMEPSQEIWKEGISILDSTYKEASSFHANLRTEVAGEGEFFSLKEVAKFKNSSNKQHHRIIFSKSPKICWKALWMQCYFGLAEGWERSLLNAIPKSLGTNTMMPLEPLHPMDVHNISSQGFVEPIRVTLGHISQAMTALQRLEFMRNQIRNFVKKPKLAKWKHWQSVFSSNATPNFRTFTSARGVSEDKDEENTETKSASKKRKLTEAEEKEELQFLCDGLRHEIIEFGSSVEFSTENYKWDLIFAVNTQISILGRSGLGAKIEFKGESTHCYEDCDDRYVFDIAFQSNAMATGGSDLHLHLAETSTAQMILNGAQTTVDITQTEAQKRLMKILGIRHLSTSTFGSFLGHALIPRGSFVTDTVPSFSTTKHNWRTNRGGGAYGVNHWT